MFRTSLNIKEIESCLKFKLKKLSFATRDFFRASMRKWHQKFHRFFTTDQIFPYLNQQKYLNVIKKA